MEEEESYLVVEAYQLTPGEGAAVVKSGSCIEAEAYGST